MKTRAKVIRREVNILKSPRPRFVSFVDHGANQTPFAVVKSHNGVTVMKTKPKTKGTAPAKKGVRPAPRKSAPVKKSVEELSISKVDGIQKLVFPKATFKSEKLVESWLGRNQWEDYEITEDKHDFVVKSTSHTDEDFSDIREVDINDKGISAYVGKLKHPDTADEDELAAKAAKKTEEEAAEDEDETTAEDDDADGDDDDGEGDDEESDEDNPELSEDDDDADAEDADDEDGDDTDDEETDLDEDGEPRDTTEEDEIDEEFGGVSDDDVENDEDLADDIADDDVDDEGKPVPASKKPNKRDGKAIDDREADEPDELTLPGQGLSARGPGADTAEAGRQGGVGAIVGGGNAAKSAKRKVLKRTKTGVRKMRHSNPVVDQTIRKFDSYGVYLSGGMTLKEVLEDGMGDGVPPGMNEIFNGLYKSVGNSLKNAESIDTAIKTISTEFAETVIAVHGVWTDLLAKGNKTQKAAAKKFFEENAELQITAKSANAALEGLVAKAVAKAVEPLQSTIDEQGKTIAKLRKGSNSRKSVGGDDLIEPNPKAKAQKTEEQEDADFVRSLSHKAIFGGNTFAAS